MKMCSAIETCMHRPKTDTLYTNMTPSNEAKLFSHNVAWWGNFKSSWARVKIRSSSTRAKLHNSYLIKRFMVSETVRRINRQWFDYILGKQQRPTEITLSLMFDKKNLHINCKNNKNYDTDMYFQRQNGSSTFSALCKVVFILKIRKTSLLIFSSFFETIKDQAKQNTFDYLCILTLFEKINRLKI